MMSFNKYMERHGEHGVQALIERLERYEGIKAAVHVALEERWNNLMASAPQQLAA